MQHKLMAVAAGIVLAGAATATTATAVQPVRGDQAMRADMTGQCTDMTWYGTLELEGDGGVFGMALYHIGVDAEQHGSSYHYVEGFQVFTGLLDVDGDGAIDECAPGEVVLAGTSVGSASLPNLKFRSIGTVDVATGPFAGWDGRIVYQDGVLTDIVLVPDVGPVPTAFDGDLRLN